MKVDQGEFFVFVYKDGLLSRLGHDLRLRLDRFVIEADGPAVTGRFFPDSLHVDTAMRDGIPRPGDLSSKDRQEIEQTIATRILLVDQHPVILLEAEATELGPDRLQVEGVLTLLGHSEKVSLSVSRSDGVLTGEVALVPSRFGIKPFRALMGALRLQDRVSVRFQLPNPSS